MAECLAVGAGGFVGAVLRYLLSSVQLGNLSFPLMTMIINITGSLMIGIIMGMLSLMDFPDEKWVLFLKVGVCGGFTTFSTYALELSGLFGEGRWAAGISYGALSVVLCLSAVYIGQWAGRTIAGMIA